MILNLKPSLKRKHTLKKQLYIMNLKLIYLFFVLIFV